MGYFTYLSPSVFSRIYLMKDHPFQMPLRQGCVSAMDPTQDKPLLSHCQSLRPTVWLSVYTSLIFFPDASSFSHSTHFIVSAHFSVWSMLIDHPREAWPSLV